MKLHAAAVCTESCPEAIPSSSPRDCVFSGRPSPCPRDTGLRVLQLGDVLAIWGCGKPERPIGPLPAEVPSYKASVSRPTQSPALTPVSCHHRAPVSVPKKASTRLQAGLPGAEVSTRGSPAVQTGQFLHLCVLWGPVCGPHTIITAAMWWGHRHSKMVYKGLGETPGMWRAPSKVC